MRIVLFRHGPAGHADAARWPDDDLRPLSPDGEGRTLAAAEGLAELCSEARVFTSPLKRAEQTARLLCRALGDEPAETVEWLRPGASYRRVLEELRGMDSDASAVLVGHEPDLGRLAGVLVFGAPKGLPLKKAGACAIEFVGPVEPGEGVFKWMAPARMLRRMARKRSRT
jgi:phosphohistidine phosphatase